MTVNALYEFSAWTKDGHSPLPLHEATFAAISDANKLLRFGLGIEEKFDLLLENYAELEHCILKMALNYSIFLGGVDILLKNGRHTANRHLTNFLATSRLYLDQTAHALSERYGASSKEQQDFKNARTTEYDTVLGYRVMEELRNHSQHRSLPINSITFGTKNEEQGASLQFRHSVSIALAVEPLTTDSKFKATILAELKAKADARGYVPLLPLVRAHVEALGRVHTAVRAWVAPVLLAADKCITENLEAATKALNKEVTILKALKLAHNGTWEIEENLLKIYTERRVDLERKNRHLEKLSNRYVSSQH